MAIPRFSADASQDDIYTAIEDAGCAVVTGLMDEQLRDSIRTELAPHMDHVRVLNVDDPAEFYPGRTRRVSTLVDCQHAGDL